MRDRNFCWKWRTLVTLSVMVVALMPVTISANRRKQPVRRQLRSYSRRMTSSGNFCPYTVSKMVSCKVVNGTETYTGKVAVGQRIQLMTMQRPRYVTSFKEVQETEYGCCPGFHGSNCDISCFNCTQIYNLESRVRTLEAKLLRSPTSSLPPLDPPVIQMGLPDTSHVSGHPLNGRRDRGRGQRGRGRGRDRNGRNGKRGGGRQTPSRGSDIDIEEESGYDAYDLDNTVSLPRPTLSTAPSSPDQCSCPPGLPGPPGQPGLSGRDGIDGRDGAAGIPGLPGAVTQTSGRGDGSTTNYIPGPPGAPGPPGLSGLKGLTGDAGRNGQRGRPGRAGRDGQAGADGSSGPPGLPGIGLPGPNGESGLPGLIGEQGIAGPVGLPGIIGPPGRNGEAGLNGIAGRPGGPGPKGEIGPVGAPGPKGEIGFHGPVGPRGIAGPQGPPGPPGATIPIPGGLDQFGGDYPGGDGFEGSGYEILIDDDEYPLGIPGIVPRGRPGLPGPKGEKGDHGDGGRTGIPGPKGDQGFGTGSGAPEEAESRPIQGLFQTVAMLRENLNLLDARVRILETELPKIIGLAGEETLLPGYPDAPYDPNSSASSVGAAADELYKQVDRLNGLVSSALPTLDGGSTSALQPPPHPDSRLPYPVEAESSEGIHLPEYDSYDYSDPLAPTEQPTEPPTEAPRERDPILPSVIGRDTRLNTTEEEEEEEDEDYYDYDYGPYEYDNNSGTGENYYEYEYYEYAEDVRRKRHPSAKGVNIVNVSKNSSRSDVEQRPTNPAVSETPEHTRALRKDKGRKIKKSKVQNKRLKNKKRYNNAVPHGTRSNERHTPRSDQSPAWDPFSIPKSTTTISPRQALQKRVEKIRALKQRTQKLRARRKNTSSSRDDLHPLRRAANLTPRTKRDSGLPQTKSSIEDITWI